MPDVHRLFSCQLPTYNSTRPGWMPCDDGGGDDDEEGEGMDVSEEFDGEGDLGF